MMVYEYYSPHSRVNACLVMVPSMSLTTSLVVLLTRKMLAGGADDTKLFFKRIRTQAKIL
jgi:hypothetical protein